MPLPPSDRALGDLLVGRRIITLPQLDGRSIWRNSGT